MSDTRSIAMASEVAAVADPLMGRGWDLYLIAAAALIPLVEPGGPGQSAIVDFVNVIGLAIFAAVLLVRRIQLRLPFALPIVIISAGSLLAMTNAVSLPASLLAVLQDAYLYLWFVMLVALMSGRGDLYPIRRAWVIAADLVVLYCIVSTSLGHGLGIGVGDSWRALLPSSDFRPAAAFSNANQFADYLMLSTFVLLGLHGRVSRRFFLGSMALIGLGMLATKSNGGIFATAAGVGVWTFARARASQKPMTRLLGVACVASALLLIGAWAHAEWGLGRGALRNVEKNTFAGRLQKSTESRTKIWQDLEHSFMRSPLGIAPGNSSLQVVAIGDQVRSDRTFMGKEAHSDYMGYAVERGPIGLIGLLAFFAMAFATVVRGRRYVRQRAGDAHWATLWAALLGALTATIVHSSVIEAMHFRHLWMSLAMVCALASAPPAERPEVVRRSVRSPRAGVPVPATAR